VIGDIYVENRSSVLPLKEEYDGIGPHSEVGRENLTYEVWRSQSLASTIEAVRPKINGERFIYVNENSQSLIRGFKDVLVPKNFTPRLLEYYAGDYYVLYPLITKVQTFEVLEGGLPVSRNFLPHPFMTPGEMVVEQEKYFNHKYDGIMLWSCQREYRAKWDPTLEVEIDKTVWEVSLGEGSLLPVKPRPGKVAVPPSSALSRLRSCFRGGFVLPFLRSQGPQVLPAVITHSQDMVVKQTQSESRSGVKVFFITKDRKLVGIREHGKRWDLIGGQLNFQETPIDALLREIKEETGLSMSVSQFVKAGVTTEQSDQGTWISHVFFAVAPSSLVRCPCVEAYSFSNLSDFAKSGLARPRQVWVARHLEMISHWFSSWDEAWSLAMILFGVENVIGKTVPLLAEVRDFAFQSEGMKKIVGKWFVSHKSRFIFQDDQALLVEYLMQNMIYFERKWLPIFISWVNPSGTISMGMFPMEKEDVVHLAEVKEEKSALSTGSSVDLVSHASSMVGPSPLLSEDGSEIFPLIPRNVGDFPTDTDGMKALILQVFGKDVKLEAQDFYHRLHSLGWKGGRRGVLKWLDKVLICKILVAHSATSGKGRIFVLQT